MLPSTFDRLSTDSHVRLSPPNALVFVYARVPVRGFPHGLDVSPPHRHLGKMVTGNGVPSGQFPHFRQRNIDTLLIKEAHDPVLSPIPSPFQLAAQFPQVRRFRGKPAAQNT